MLALTIIGANWALILVSLHTGECKKPCPVGETGKTGGVEMPA
jgi:hypothetical protein